MVSMQMGIISLNDINQLIFAMKKFGVFFEVRTELLSIISMTFFFKVLKCCLYYFAFTEGYNNVNCEIF
jgi:hypothetical protein